MDAMGLRAFDTANKPVYITKELNKVLENGVSVSSTLVDLKATIGTPVTASIFLLGTTVPNVTATPTSSDVAVVVTRLDNGLIQLDLTYSPDTLDPSGVGVSLVFDDGVTTDVYAIAIPTPDLLDFSIPDTHVSFGNIGTLPYKGLDFKIDVPAYITVADIGTPTLSVTTSPESLLDLEVGNISKIGNSIYINVKWEPIYSPIVWGTLTVPLANVEVTAVITFDGTSDITPLVLTKVPTPEVIPSLYSVGSLIYGNEDSLVIEKVSYSTNGVSLATPAIGEVLLPRSENWAILNCNDIKTCLEGLPFTNLGTHHEQPIALPAGFSWVTNEVFPSAFVVTGPVKGVITDINTQNSQNNETGIVLQFSNLVNGVLPNSETTSVATFDISCTDTSLYGYFPLNNITISTPPNYSAEGFEVTSISHGSPAVTLGMNGLRLSDTALDLTSTPLSEVFTVSITYDRAKELQHSGYIFTGKFLEILISINGGFRMVRGSFTVEK